MRAWRATAPLAIAGLLVAACATGGSEAGSTSNGDVGSGSTQPATGDPTTSTAGPVVGVDPVTSTDTEITPSTIGAPRTTAAAGEEDPVPVGEVVEITGLWDIAVTEVNLDAAAEVLAFADINPAPAAGFRYVMVSIEGVYLGDRVAQPAFEWAVSDGETEYLPSIPGCGVIPDSIYDVAEVVSGEKFRANLCVPVSEEATGRGLVLYLRPAGDEPWYFDLSR